jgi:mannose/fructose/N-acetylgalactosamine-specific phosphotransferase system component IID
MLKQFSITKIYFRFTYAISCNTKSEVASLLACFVKSLLSQMLVNVNVKLSKSTKELSAKLQDISPSLPPFLLPLWTQLLHIWTKQEEFSQHKLMYIVVSNRTIVLRVFYTFIKGRCNSYHGRCNNTLS